MSIFSKSTYKDVSLSFIHDCYEDCYKENLEAGCIDIEAYGIIDGEQKYLYSSHFLKDLKMYDNGDYDEMIESLKDTSGKKITVRLKYKKDRLIGFKILLESLAEAMCDERFLSLADAAGWGINDRSCTEK